MIPGRLSAALAALLSAGAAGAALPVAVGDAIDAAGIAQDQVSIVVEDAQSGAVRYALNASVPRSPASTLKLVTSYATLELLGPSYTWRTRAWVTGKLRAGRLNGDLIIEGGGDPELTAERWAQFAREVVNSGITHIGGDIVIDRSLYEEQAGSSDDFDGLGFRVYNVLPDALLVNLQSVEVHFVHDDGGRLTLTADPAPVNLALVNHLGTTSGSCLTGLAGVHISDPDPGRLLIQGSLARRCPPLALRRAVLNAPTFAYGTFVANYRAAGGSIAGDLRLAPRPGDARPLFEFESLPLAEVVRIVNKWSINAMARMLYLTLGVERAGAPASESKSQATLTAWLAGRHLDCPELVMDNGSGLSHAARISAACLAGLLNDAHRSPYFPELAASLPIAGADGTLRHRFSELKSDGRVRLKTGTLGDVAAVAGWLVTAAGEPLSVVVFVNAPGAGFGAGQSIADAVVREALRQ
jgi:D-alanyl-D-alanine carboxypeptidase/D-alanyl-D-alanine-endopeptidase (penicillin-binding protein 4)